MKSILKLTLAILLFLLCFSVGAQKEEPNAAALPDSVATPAKKDRSLLVKDTAQINLRYQLIHPVLDINFYTKKNLDTTLHNLHRYLPTENDTQLWQQASNLGQTPYLISLPKAPKIGIRLGAPQANIYNFTLENSPFYQNQAPYTFARYIIGADTEQLFEVKHAQNFSPLISVALKYQFIGSQGAYREQDASINNIAANAWLKSPNKRYNFLVAYLSNNEKRKENGGVVHLGNLFQNSTTFRLNTNVYLSNAESQAKSSQFFAQQSFDFGIVKDSLNTIDSVYVQWLEPTFRLIHRLDIAVQQRQYADITPPNNYYPNYFYTNSDIADSTHLRLYCNEFLLAWEGKIKQKDSGLRGTAGLALLNGKMAWKTLNSDTSSLNWHKNVNTLLWKTNLFSTPDFRIKKLQWQSNFEYGISGFNAQNIYWNSKANYLFLEKWKLNAAYLLSVQTPDLLFLEYHSANHDWQNNLQAIQQNRLTIGASFKNLIDLSYQIGQLKNYTYFNQIQAPQQLNNNITIQSINLQSHLIFKNYYHWRTQIVAQSDNAIQIAIPTLYLQSEVYFEGKVLKNALELQAGFMCNYLTAFKAGIYSPSLGHFYLQTNETIAQYPLLDFFVNMKIKRATIFVRSYHILQGLLGMDGMFAHPNYPLPDRAFKFGFSWGFYD